MTDRRIHAWEYTAEEIAAMQPGPLLDWLAWQGTHAVQRPRLAWFIFDSRISDTAIMAWHPDKDKPRSSIAESSISSDPGAAMRALKAVLASKDKRVSVYFYAHMDKWHACVEYKDEAFKVFGVDTPELAIARALALYARAKQIQQKEKA